MSVQRGTLAFETVGSGPKLVLGTDEWCSDDSKSSRFENQSGRAMTPNPSRAAEVALFLTGPAERQAVLKRR